VLSWRLYEQLNNAPKELKSLGKDLATVYGVLNHIQNDLEAKESSIASQGEDRMKMLESMVKGLQATLEEIQALVDKFQPMSAETKTPEQLWIRLKWAVGYKKIKRIHQDISFHIAGLNLLLTSMGK